MTWLKPNESTYQIARKPLSNDVDVSGRVDDVLEPHHLHVSAQNHQRFDLRVYHDGSLDGADCFFGYRFKDVLRVPSNARVDNGIVTLSEALLNGILTNRRVNISSASFTLRYMTEVF
jgi:hypothetical protein